VPVLLEQRISNKNRKGGKKEVEEERVQQQAQFIRVAKWVDRQRLTVVRRGSPELSSRGNRKKME